MIDAQVQAHREFFLANTPGQRLFVALHLQPQEAARVRPALAVAFVVDTSQSMRSRVTRPTGFGDLLFGGGKNKLELVIEALSGLVTSGLLLDSDHLSLTRFDDDASVLLPFTPATDQARVLARIEQLSRYSGGTHMGQGMQAATKLFRAERGNRRMVVLTDGQTTDERLVLSTAARLAEQQIPVTTIGVGQDVNTELLTKVADLTQGQPMDVVPDSENPGPPAVRASELPAALLGDLKNAANEVVTNVTLGIRTLKDVTVERVTRVQPTQSEVNLSRQPLMLGNLDAQGGSTFVIEFSVPARPAARVRLGQLLIGYEVPGVGQTGELPPQDVVVEFTADDSLAARINPDVMRWVQQRNIESLVVQATREARGDPQRAHESLMQARQLTERLGHHAMTRVLDQAIGELSAGKQISAGTAKTLQIGAKTQTLRQEAGVPSDDEIRRMTGA